MPRGEERASEDERQSALLDVALPIVAVVVVATVAMLVVGGDLDDRVQSMGWWFFGVTGAGVTGLAGTCTLLWLQRRGRRVPVAFTLFFATLPWLTGLGGMRFGMHRVEQALEHADWSMVSMMTVRGYAEASTSAAYGLHLSSALLSAITLVLAIRAERIDRSRVFIGAVVASVILGFVGPAMAIADEGAASMMLVPLLASLVGYGACAGRRGAPGVAVAGFLATLTACSATMFEAAFPRLAVVASIGYEQRHGIFEDLVFSLTALDRGAWIAIAAIGVAALLLVGESVRRAERSQVWRVGALALVALSVLALHRVSSASSKASIEAWTRVPWEHVEDFELARTTDGSWSDEPRIVMSTRGAIWLDLEPVQPPDSATLREALEEAQRRREAIVHEIYEEETPEWLLEEEIDDIGARSKLSRDEPANRYGIGARYDEDAVREAREQARWVGRFWERPVGGIEGCAIGGRPVEGLVDARAPVHGLFVILEASANFGLIGRTGPEIPESLRRFTLLANVAERDSLRTVATISTPVGACDAIPSNDILFTAVLGTEPVEMLRDYETGVDMPIPSSLEQQATDQPVVVFVRPEEGATVQHLVDLAHTLRVADPLSLVLVRELPELPPLTPLATEISEAARDGNLVLSSAHPETLQPVLEAGRADLELCARRMLTVSPDLDAYIRVSAQIASDGRVRVVRTLADGSGLRAMRACIADVVRAWAFPALEEDTVFTVGLILGTPDEG